MLAVTFLVVAVVAALAVVAYLLYAARKPSILGLWSVVNSTAVFRITLVEGRVHIEGWDSNDGERFEISDVRWDGNRLRGTFVMPSTGHTTHADLRFRGANTLQGPYKGDSSGTEVWKRQ